MTEKTIPASCLPSYEKLPRWVRRRISSRKMRHNDSTRSERTQVGGGGCTETGNRPARSYFRLILSTIHGTPPAETDVATFNTFLSHAMARSYIVPGEHDFAWGWPPKSMPGIRLRCGGARSSDLLTSEELKYVRICASDTCGWLFIDQSKTHTRRWCDMKSCGTAPKPASTIARRNNLRLNGSLNNGHSRPPAR